MYFNKRNFKTRNGITYDIEGGHLVKGGWRFYCILYKDNTELCKIVFSYDDDKIEEPIDITKANVEVFNQSSYTFNTNVIADLIGRLVYIQEQIDVTKRLKRGIGDILKEMDSYEDDLIW